MRTTTTLFALLATLPLGRASAAQPALPKGLLTLPLTRQATTYSCAAAALQSVLFYWQVYDGGETGLYPALETTPKDGTEPPKILEVAKSYGLEASLREHWTVPELREALKRGETVILDIQAWRETGSSTPWKDDWEDGHYVVLAGMDAENVYLMDPSSAGAYAFMPLAELEDRWHDYEDRHGAVRRYDHLGIAIRGKKHLHRVPAGPVRIE